MVTARTLEVFREDVIGREIQLLQIEEIVQKDIIVLEVVDVQEEAHVKSKSV